MGCKYGSEEKPIDSQSLLSDINDRRSIHLNCTTKKVHIMTESTMEKDRIAMKFWIQQPNWRRKGIVEFSLITKYLGMDPVTEVATDQILAGMKRQGSER